MSPRISLAAMNAPPLIDRIKTIGHMLLTLVATDRLVQAGGATSGVSLAGGVAVQQSAADPVTSFVAVWATWAGAAGATLTVVLLSIKIYRLLRDPKATG